MNLLRSKTLLTLDPHHFTGCEKGQGWGRIDNISQTSLSPRSTQSRLPGDGGAHRNLRSRCGFIRIHSTANYYSGIEHGKELMRIWNSVFHAIMRTASIGEEDSLVQYKTEGASAGTRMPDGVQRNGGTMSTGQFLNRQDLQARHDDKQKKIGMKAYMGINLVENADLILHPDGSVSARTPPSVKPKAELVIVLANGRPPTQQFAADLLRAIPNTTDQTACLAYGIYPIDWNDYNLQSIIDSLIFVDYPDYFPIDNSRPQKDGGINLLPAVGDYYVEYIRDRKREGMAPVQPEKWVCGVVRRIPVQAGRGSIRGAALT
jgi:hypothetical protein